MCAACHQDLPKDKFSKKQWKLGAECQRRCTSCVRDNREIQPPPAINNESTNNDTGIASSLSSLNMNDSEMISVSDNDLFKVHLQKEDCPICFLRLPSLHTGYKYMLCCGKVICSGCVHANAGLTDDAKCAFCRTPDHNSQKEAIKRLRKRVEINDPSAIYNLGCCYDKGTHGLPQNHVKALELYLRAGELGCADAYYNIGNAYMIGEGVERDVKTGEHYWKLAAMRGDIMARHNLGVLEERDRALKHFMVSAMGGQSDSLDAIKELYMDGHATKDDYSAALRAHQVYLDEIKSGQRDEAAAVSDLYTYY